MLSVRYSCLVCFTFDYTASTYFFFFPLLLVAKMAVVNVPFPSFFLPCPGEPAMPFCTWLRIFENYLRVIDATGDSWPDVRRRAVLLHCLGTEGQLFYSLPNISTTFKDAEAALKAYFVPKTNIVAEHHTFRKCCQAPHETVIQYVAALRELVVTCEFGACADEMIRNQLVENVLSPRIRERLLLETDLTLDRAVTIANQIESASDQAKSISNFRQITAPIQAVQHVVKRRRGKPSHAPLNSVHVGKRKACFRCGSETHLADAANCPAATATCRKCKKTGHYTKVCRSAQSNTHEVHEIELPEVTVLYTEYPARPPSITSTVTISTSADQAFVVNLVADTGSSVLVHAISVMLHCHNQQPGL